MKIEEIQNLMEIDQKKAEKFKKFMDMLIEKNKVMNLTAITDENEIIEKHFLDSLTISKYIKESDLVIDVGTGAGFPGIPLKIDKNIKKITLLDSLRKRIDFIEEVINELALENVELIHGRAEDFANDDKYREKYDIATSRAVASLRVLSEYLLPFVKIGGRMIAMKGNHIEEELEESKNAINKLGGEIEKVIKIKLNNKEIERNLIIIKKIKQTNKQYPRKSGIPSKKPL